MAGDKAGGSADGSGTDHGRSGGFLADDRPSPSAVGPASIEQPSDELHDDKAARLLVEYHREIAAKLPPTSRVRAAALRCATQWSLLVGLPQQSLSLAPEQPRQSPPGDLAASAVDLA